ncbi:MAG: FtsW/RodA/SpoVE family cell cycle protein, partial [Anaerolineales bacterium]|nr:FtsW/RodA/SpoVE family cell cycle protein [Anaerolineales bacterium]
MSTLLKRKSSTGSVTSNRRELWRNFDWILVVAVALLLTMGTAMIRSSTFEHPTLYDTPRQQIQYAIVGFALIWMLASIDYRYWQSLSKFLYMLIIIALLAVFVLGVVAGGAQRWFDFFGLFNIQPSELAKIGSVIWIASFFAHRRNQLNQFRWIMLSIIHAGIPAALVMAQPDLSSAVMIIVVWLSILWTAGVRPQHLAILSGASMAGLPAIWVLMEEYQRNRVINFLNPSLDPGAQYNVRQALISIGSGGWFGQGYNQASQVQLRFLKVRHTDFIFSATAAEFGLLGVIV